jgi:quercetin dioxygenase-like cupin family protein
MKMISALASSALILAGAAAPAAAEDQHKIIAAPDIQWAPAPVSMPSGAQTVVLYGDPSKDQLFVMRLKVPSGYKIPPHTHPKPEVVTVISGTMKLGMGEMADESKAQTLSAGSFFALAPNTPHYVFAVEETVVQLSAIGPWSITYVNPKDDPRQSQ